MNQATTILTCSARLPVGNIELQEIGLPTCCRDFCHNRFAFGTTAATMHRHSKAILCQAQGNGPTNPSAGAGYQYVSCHTHLIFPEQNA